MKAVIVVDMINDFVSGKFGSERAQAIVPAVTDFIARARKKKLPVVYLQDAHSAEDTELGIWGVHAMSGSRGSEIVEELAPARGDIVIPKQTYSGFVGTGLAVLLRDLGVDTLIFVGVSTDICVQNNVGSAFFSGFRSIVLSDCTASITHEGHEQALKYMKAVYGAGITTSAEVVL
ncbi:MAG TPA: cysteine hydrolase [Candidatus Methanoperedenaceae archaeon]|nr:cysteine hydrolase [Candidatus Methanoperedenaceae archaeon]